MVYEILYASRNTPGRCIRKRTRKDDVNAIAEEEGLHDDAHVLSLLLVRQVAVVPRRMHAHDQPRGACSVHCRQILLQPRHLP